MTRPTPMRRARLGVTIISLALAAGCSTGTGAASDPPATTTATATVVASASAAASAPPSLDPSLIEVPATANIYGAGHDELPAPGGGGPGTEPVEVDLPDGSRRAVTISDAVGSVIPISSLGIANGAEGAGYGITNIESVGGISGIQHGSNTMFLVGVFLTDEEPADPAPDRLDFSENEDYELLEPEIAQVFLIGDGDGKTIAVPDEATRFYLGFADAASFVGQVGWYGNNSGSVAVRVTVSTDG